MRHRHVLWSIMGVMTILATLIVAPAAQAARQNPVPEGAVTANSASEPFERTWRRTDGPVARGTVSRTWMWGPEPLVVSMEESYAESPEGVRQVRYYDKSRMEITNPDADPTSSWYVTNGLLVVELMTGRVQTGNDSFQQRAPAEVNVAGDRQDPFGPTYATMALLRDAPAHGEGIVITARVNRAGAVTDDPALAPHGVTAGPLVHETGHRVATPFWQFMTSSGLVDDGTLTTAPLFENPYYATGLPVTEAYWASVQIDGIARDVLLQCFERRCLTFAPGNPPAWQVEAGNVGLHYYGWRYPGVPEGPAQGANALARAVTEAGSDQARYEALLAVLDALHVGVYTGSAEKVLGGAERGPADFYVYDAEVRMMAAAMGRGDTWGLAEIAMTLTAMEVLPAGEVLKPETVRQALLKGVKASRSTPDEWTSLSPLLLRQLGVSAARPYDLFEEPGLQVLRLDALSYFLLLSELSVPLVADQFPLASSASDLVAHSNGILTVSTSNEPCSPPALFDGDATRSAWGWTKIFAELMQLAPHAVAKGTAVLDAIHGAMLAYSVRVSALDETVEAHYGHEGVGEVVTFRVKVEMLDDVGEMLLNCGWVAGTSFPAKGPIQGVSVHWFWPELAKHGSIFCGTACVPTGESGLSIDASGADGIASMTFLTKVEANPGSGWVVQELGTVTGIALYQSKFTNLLGSYGQYLTPKSGATRWSVEWHEEPSYRVRIEGTYAAMLHDASVSAQDPTSSTYRAAGTVVYEIGVPASALSFPYPFFDQIMVRAQAVGTESTVSVATRPGGLNRTCYVSLDGSWTMAGVKNDDGARSRGEPVTRIQFKHLTPPEAVYSGSCGWNAHYDLDYWNFSGQIWPWVDLTADGVRTRTESLCPASHSADISCEGSITWTITVDKPWIQPQQ